VTRVLLVAGKGGVGKTTVAAATALAAAREGLRTLVVSTDPAHSLTDALGLTGRTGQPREWRTAGDPLRVEAAPGHLDVLQIDTRARVDESWTTLRRTAGGLLAGAGVDPIVAEEIATVPGLEDVLSLLDVAAHAPGYDAVVVDCAPTAETLRLLALPEAVDRLVRRGLPVESRIMRLVAGQGLPPATVEALDALDDLCARLRSVRDLVSGPHAAVRLVTTPERVVLAETARARTTLALLGHHVEGVVVNRVAVGEQWPAALVARHREGLVAARDRFAALPVRHAPYADDEPVGAEALLALADVALGGGDPLDLGAGRTALDIRDAGDRWLLDLPVPGASADDVDLAVTDDGALVVDLGPHRRVIELPAVLRRCEVEGASLDLTDGGQVLRVRFVPDEAQWSVGMTGTSGGS
jgi:arsenite-transporting ATPase